MIDHSYYTPADTNGFAPLTNEERLLSTSRYLKTIRNGCVAAFVTAEMSKTQDEAVNLFEELSLIKSIAVGSVEAYAAAREAELTNPNSAAVRALVQATALQMRANLMDVVTVTERITKLAYIRQKAYTVDLNSVILSLLTVIDEECDHDTELLKRINTALRSKFDELDDRGLIALLPHEDLEAMDGTVPTTARGDN